jgi:hypothetical protein
VNPLNAITVPRVGSDSGVTALVSRREALGVGRLNRLSQVVGTGEERDGQADLRLIKLSDETGFLNQESITVYRDVVHFLWFDGLYEWSDNGIVCVSDGTGNRGRVRSWFATDDYFDRAKFAKAFARSTRTATSSLVLTVRRACGTMSFDLINRVWAAASHRPSATSVFLRLGRTT